MAAVLNVYHAILSFLHLLATASWIGGMIFYVLVLTPSLGAIDPPQRGKLLGALIKRYASFAWGAVIVLIITGILKTTALGVGQFLFTTTYGIFLGIKHIIILVMIVIGAIVSFGIGPKLMALSKKPPDTSSGAPPAGPPPEVVKLQRMAGNLGYVNLVLGVAVLLLTAFL